MRTLLLAAALALVVQAGAAGQSAVVVPGRVTERVRSPADTTQTYAAYLPSSYDSVRAWPVLFVMDPRGRAVAALEPFRAAAERFGVIVLSSYNTLSDGPAEPNVRAMNAMLADAQGSFRMDFRRLYLAGFSGTARIGWDFAAQMGDAVAGLYGAGASAGVATRLQLGGTDAPGLAYFGAAGTTDFNYEEVRGFDTWLDRTGVPHRVRYFDGPHAWPPAEVAAEALGWFELRAMLDDRRPVDRALVDSLLAADTVAARQLEFAGRGADALARWREVVADYAKLGDVSVAQARVDALSRDRAVRRTLERRADFGREFVRYSDRLVAWLEAAHGGARPPRAEDGIRRLEVEKLRREAADATDRERADAARRNLAQAFVSVSFYEPRTLLERGDAERALVLLEVADAIQPGSPGVPLMRARALVRLDRTDEALAALEAAAAAGAPAALIADDPAFATLRSDPRFRAIVR